MTATTIICECGQIFFLLKSQSRSWKNYHAIVESAAKESRECFENGQRVDCGAFTSWAEDKHSHSRRGLND